MARPHSWDIHIHTHYSPDSCSKIADIFRAAKSKSLDGIAITDHNSLKGYLEAKPLARKWGLGMVAGYEYRAAEGDLTILGIEEMPGKPRLPAREAVDFAHERGGAAIAVHPFDPFRPGIGKLLYGKIKVDAIETINAHCFIYGNRKAAKVALANSIAQVGGSDAHAPSEVGSAFTVFDGPGDILKAIKSGTTRAAGGVNLPTFPDAISAPVLAIPYRFKAWLARRLNRPVGDEIW